MTIDDIARLSGVSTATVSRIINNKTGFSEKTRQKVLRIIEENDYSINAVAQGLARKKTNSLGVILPSLSGFFISSILTGIEKAAHNNNHSVIISNSEDKDLERNLRLLREKQVDGILVISSYLDSRYKDCLGNPGIPIVVLSTKSPFFSFPFVKVDDFQASYDAVKYLIEKGHKKIAMISGTSTDPIAGKPRIDGYKLALSDYNIPVQEDFIRQGDFRYRSGLSAMEKILDDRLDITAVFVASDEMAAGAYKAILSRNLSIPGDISLIGYDDTALAEILHPGLTSLHQPIEEMGEEAIRLLIEGAKPGEGQILAHKITERGSVRSLTENE